MPRKYDQGEYTIMNWDKYVGTKNPRYLSSYEREVFSYLDRAKSVIEWGAEVVKVPYYNEVKQRNARYIVDVYVKYMKNGEIVTELIEIKPFSQTLAPKRGNKSAKTYESELATFIENRCKWVAAAEFAKQRQWKFRILTERSIFR